MADYSRTMGLVVLACKHVLRFPKPFPKVGEELYCRKCNTIKAVTAVPKRVAHKVPGLSV